MTEHEHDPTPGQTAEQGETDQPSPANLITAPEMRLDRMPEQESDEAARIRHGIDTFGLAFVANLTCDGIDHSAPDLLELFGDHYLGWFPHRRAFLDMQLEALGWSDELALFREQQGIQDDDLDWNYDAIWRKSEQDMDLVERLGGVYVFWRQHTERVM